MSPADEIAKLHELLVAGRLNSGRVRAGQGSHPRYAPRGHQATGSSARSCAARRPTAGLAASAEESRRRPADDLNLAPDLRGRRRVRRRRHPRLHPAVDLRPSGDAGPLKRVCCRRSRQPLPASTCRVPTLLTLAAPQQDVGEDAGAGEHGAGREDQAPNPGLAAGRLRLRRRRQSSGRSTSGAAACRRAHGLRRPGGIPRDRSLPARTRPRVRRPATSSSCSLAISSAGRLTSPSAPARPAPSMHDS